MRPKARFSKAPETLRVRKGISLVNLYLRTEKCIPLNSCMEGTSLHKYYEYKTALCDKEGNFARLSRCENVWGPFKKHDPVFFFVRRDTVIPTFPTCEHLFQFNFVQEAC